MKIVKISINKCGDCPKHYVQYNGMTSPWKHVCEATGQTITSFYVPEWCPLPNDESKDD